MSKLYEVNVIINSQTLRKLGWDSDDKVATIVMEEANFLLNIEGNETTFEFPLYEVTSLAILSNLVTIETAQGKLELKFYTEEEAVKFNNVYEYLIKDGFNSFEFQVLKDKNFYTVLEHISPRVYATYTIIILNIIYYIWIIASGGNALSVESKLAINLGANFGPMTLNGEIWRIFTSMFIHFSLLHLLVNMQSLFYLGSFVEKLYGSKHFIMLYLISGLFGSIFSLLINPTIVSAGASGAVFGVCGAFIVFLYKPDLKIPKNVILKFAPSLALFVIFNIGYGLINSNSIDNGAHIGGLIGGMIIGYLISRPVSINARLMESRHLISSAIKCAIALTLCSILFIFINPIHGDKIEKVNQTIAFNNGLVAYNDQDYPTAFNKFTQEANKGNPEAQYMLGMMYKEGLGTDKDGKRAFELITLSSDQGDIDAKGLLGSMLLNGTGTAVNKKRALDLILYAANKGNILSQLNLGFIYLNGEDAVQSFSDSLLWYKRAAVNGNKNAQVNIGNIYEQGLGVTPNYVTALVWYTMSARGNEKLFVDRIEELKLKMRPPEIIKANELAERCILNKFVECP